MFYLNSTLNFGIFQVEVYYEVDRLLTGLTAQQKGTTARWCSFNNTFIQESTSSHLLTKSLYVELLKKEMFMSFFKLILSLFKTWTTINVVRNARCARSRYTLKLSPFFNQSMNESIN